MILSSLAAVLVILQSSRRPSLHASICLKDLGALSYILGMEIKRDCAARTLEITQKAYVEKMLQRFQMEECKPVGTPAS